MAMWKEWRTTVWQRSLGIVVHRECAVEADQRNDGKKVSSKPLRPNLWKNRRKPIENNNNNNAVICQTYDSYVSCMWDPTLQNYPYNIIVIVSDSKVWLRSC
jgi:hypothetical protein